MLIAGISFTCGQMCEQRATLLPPRKRSFPRWATPPTPPESVRAVEWTPTPEAKYFASISYQRFLPMMLRWRTSRAGVPL